MPSLDSLLKAASDDIATTRPLNRDVTVESRRNKMNYAPSIGNRLIGGSHRYRFPFNLRLVTFVLVITSWIVPARLDEHDHEYKNNEEVILWMNTVGPYHNRQETYSYFSLPFCKGTKPTIGHYHETLGEALQVRNIGVSVFVCVCLCLSACL